MRLLDRDRRDLRMDDESIAARGVGASWIKGMRS
jgi:hypothetical protein